MDLQIVVVVCMVVFANGDATPEVVMVSPVSPKVHTAVPTVSSSPKATTDAMPKATPLAPKTSLAAQSLTIFKLKGEMMLEVSDIAAFSSDRVVAAIYQKSLAACVGLPASDVKIVKIKIAHYGINAKSHGERRLSAGTMNVEYEIKDKSSSVLPSNVAASGSAMKFETNLALQTANVQGSITKVTFSTPSRMEMPRPTFVPVHGNPCLEATTTRSGSGQSNMSLPAELSKAVDMVKNTLRSPGKLAKSMAALPVWEKKAGIAAASIAGAAGVAGGIVGIVESQAPATPASQKVVTVRVPVKVEVPVAGTVSVLYDDDMKKPASGTIAGDDTILTNVAMRVIFMVASC